MNELDIIFESIRSQLNNTESKEEVIQIYYNAIERFESLGLLGDNSGKQVEGLVTFRFQQPLLLLIIDWLYGKG